MESPNYQVRAVLLSVEIKHHKIPYLKALTHSIKRRGGHGHDSTFKQFYTVMKSTILPHKWSKRRFHVTVAVCMLFIMFFYLSFITLLPKGA